MSPAKRMGLHQEAVCVRPIVTACTIAATLLAPATLLAEQRIENIGKELVGKPAPNFTLKDTSGRAWKLSDLRGKRLVVLDFGRTYCVGCRDTAEDLERIHKAYTGKGVQVFTVCINAEELKTVKEFISDLDLTFPVLRDVQHKAAKAYYLQMIPFTVIVQKSGYVHWVHAGHPDDYVRQVQAQLDGLLSRQ